MYLCLAHLSIFFFFIPSLNSKTSIERLGNASTRNRGTLRRWQRGHHVCASLAEGQIQEDYTHFFLLFFCSFTSFFVNVSVCKYMYVIFLFSSSQFISFPLTLSQCVYRYTFMPVTSTVDSTARIYVYKTQPPLS